MQDMFGDGNTSFEIVATKLDVSVFFFPFRIILKYYYTDDDDVDGNDGDVAVTMTMIVCRARIYPSMKSRSENRN